MAFLEFDITENNCFVVPSNGPVISEKGKINYPVMRFNGKPVKTRKLVYEECYGLVPAGFVIKNTCLNPRCINPEHLTIIPKAKMAEEARQRIARDNSPSVMDRVLNDEEIRLARTLLTKRSLKEVAEAFGVSEEVIEASINMPF